MKKIFYIHILLLSVFIFSCKDDDSAETSPTPPPPPAENTDTITYIYDIEALPEVTLTIPVSEWNNLLGYFDRNPYNEEYVKGAFTFSKDGTTEELSNIGVRVRGNTSRRRPEGTYGQVHNSVNPDWHHASFTVNFKKYDKQQLFYTSEKLILKWFKDDPMYVREVYCYDLFERFGVWTAPQSSFCRLNIKIEGGAKSAYFGVYQLIEPVDEIYLENRKATFSGASGNLWKANFGADLHNPDKNRMGIENITLDETYKPVYDLKTNKKSLDQAKIQLVQFINNLNSKNGAELKTWLSQTMDVDLFLKTYAVNVICGMWDDYWANSNNFYFYFNSSGKFFFIPYDYDNALGTSLEMKDSGTQDLLNWGHSTCPLVLKVISIPEYREKYISYLHQLCDSQYDYFHVDKSTARINKWHNMIRAYISNDTGEDIKIEDKPAPWGNCGFYRLLIRGSNNFFETRAASLPSLP